MPPGPAPAGAPRVLVVEDDPAVAESLRRALHYDGYHVTAAGDGHAALRLLEPRDHDAVVLDLGLPLVDGLEVCRRLRSSGDRTPVLVVTARDAVADRVAGLDAGADDYLVKPFALDELLARVRALLRRARSDDGEVLRCGDVVLDTAAMEARRGGRAMELTRTEWLLLELFMRNPRRVLTRSVVFERVWGYDFGGNSNALDVYVGYLRRKLEAAGEPRLLHTVRGFGYVLRAAAPETP
ncbi:MAG TPA: response regulator transcription factor [Candidatus Angelobacter sp.]|jgi:two-component system response regulator MprA|nr:response regulator transcription factor [Candidatus Angelobacter sp.]